MDRLFAPAEPADAPNTFIDKPEAGDKIDMFNLLRDMLIASSLLGGTLAQSQPAPTRWMVCAASTDAAVDNAAYKAGPFQVLGGRPAAQPGVAVPGVEAIAQLEALASIYPAFEAELRRRGEARALRGECTPYANFFAAVEANRLDEGDDSDFVSIDWPLSRAVAYQAPHGQVSRRWTRTDHARELLDYSFGTGWSHPFMTDALAAGASISGIQQSIRRHAPRNISFVGEDGGYYRFQVSQGELSGVWRIRLDDAGYISDVSHTPSR